MILLDTNVVSELMRPKPDGNVEAWFGSQPGAGLFLSSVTEAELRVGVALMPSGRKREKLTESLVAMLTEEFAERIIPFDSSAAIAFATIAADRYRTGRPMGQFDALIAAVAQSRGASLATRNTTDFQDCGIEIINPWNIGGAV